MWEKIIFDPSWATEFTSFLLVCRIRYRVNHFELGTRHSSARKDFTRGEGELILDVLFGGKAPILKPSYFLTGLTGILKP